MASEKDLADAGIIVGSGKGAVYGIRIKPICATDR